MSISGNLHKSFRTIVVELCVIPPFRSIWVYVRTICRRIMYNIMDFRIIWTLGLFGYVESISDVTFSVQCQYQMFKAR